MSTKALIRNPSFVPRHKLTITYRLLLLVVSWETCMGLNHAAPGLYYTAPLADRYPNIERVPAERRRIVIDLKLFFVICVKSP